MASSASATTASSATVTARRTWPAAGNCWPCLCQLRRHRVIIGSVGNRSPGTIRCSARSARRARWYESLSFLLAALSKAVTAHEHSAHLRLCRQAEALLAHGRGAGVRPRHSSSFNDAVQYSLYPRTWHPHRSDASKTGFSPPVHLIPPTKIP